MLLQLQCERDLSSKNIERVKYQFNAFRVLSFESLIESAIYPKEAVVEELIINDENHESFV